MAKLKKVFQFTMPIDEGKIRHGNIQVDYEWIWDNGWEKPECTILTVNYVSKDTITGKEIVSEDIYPVLYTLDFDKDIITERMDNDAIWRLLAMSRAMGSYTPFSRVNRTKKNDEDIITDLHQNDFYQAFNC